MVGQEHSTFIYVSTDQNKHNIDVKKTRRAKYLRLSYNPISEKFRLSVPLNSTHLMCAHFLKQQDSWIKKCALTIEAAPSASIDQIIYVWGKSCLLNIQKGLKNSVFLQGDVLHVEYLPTQCPILLIRDYIQSEARAYMQKWCIDLAQLIGKECPKIIFRDTKTRWGSCSVKGINLSWRLAMLHKDIAFYVCAHEVAHLIHMNHSDFFWSLVKKLCPSYRENRKALREYGPSVLKYKFL